MRALKNKRKLRNKKIQLRVRNGAQVAVVTVRSIELCLPSGLIMQLENVYFVLNIFRNIISISCLEIIGFSFVIKDNNCSIYKDELYYGSSFMMNDLYMLDLKLSIFIFVSGNIYIHIHKIKNKYKYNFDYHPTVSDPFTLLTLKTF
jgi:hypothetical protein